MKDLIIDNDELLLSFRIKMIDKEINKSLSGKGNYFDHAAQYTVSNCIEMLKNQGIKVSVLRKSNRLR